MTIGFERPHREKAGQKPDCLEDHANDWHHLKPSTGNAKRTAVGSAGFKGTARDRAAKRFKVEANVKEEGEISDTDEAAVQQQPLSRSRVKETMTRQSKEEKWHEWCAQMMDDQKRTLDHLQKLQTDFVLPKEEVRLLCSIDICYLLPQKRFSIFTVRKTLAILNSTIMNFTMRL